jgi:hypothetical protein
MFLCFFVRFFWPVENLWSVGADLLGSTTDVKPSVHWVMWRADLSMCLSCIMLMCCPILYVLMRWRVHWCVGVRTCSVFTHEKISIAVSGEVSRRQCDTVTRSIRIRMSSGNTFQEKQKWIFLERLRFVFCSTSTVENICVSDLKQNVMSVVYWPVDLFR